MIRRTFPAIICFVIIVLLWELLVSVFKIPSYLLPKPSVISVAMFEKLPLLYSHIKITTVESFIGFIFGSLLGIILAILFVHSRPLELGLYPYAIALKSVPIVAIAPLLIVWFGNGVLPKILVAAIISFFPVVVNTVKGMRSVDVEAFDLFDSLQASKKQIFWKLRTPTSLPYLFSSLKMSSTLAVIGAIVAEFAGSDKGLGYYILISSHRLETVDMFVGIVLSSILGISFFYFVVLAERIFLPWEKNISIDKYN